ncbi:Hypothetical predicted protein [Paramuricea clavata]|uniref:Uncharacterized protein n=1 Tax=Paramuricea clavata TaxID=317549 RepID=A0A7D9HPE8_PARCT|nr:Hypothetical predicted protein [Paramuricea clavata]
MMLQWLVLLMLFVHNSLALALYDDINDHHRWPRGGPSIATTGATKIDYSKDFPDGCHCKGYILSFPIYAKPGEQTVQVTLPEPEVICKNYVNKSVSPPSNSKFKLGRHVITYSYRYKGYKQDLKCFVNFTVAPCECPSTQTVKATVKPGETEASVTWREPEPTCPTNPSGQNPQNTRERFSIGKHTVTYKYTHVHIGFRMFDVKCHVNIAVTSMLVHA